MSTRMVSPGYYSLFPWLSEQDQTSQSNFTAEFQDLYSKGMDRALGLQENTMDRGVEMQSEALELYKNAPWFTPLLGDVFESGTRLLVFCLELQIKCLDAMWPSSVPAAPTKGAVSRAELAVQELAMDIGSGLAKKPARAQQASMSGPPAN